MARTEHFNTVVDIVDSDTPHAYVFVLQAGNDGGEPLTAAQIETARNAAKSVLEVLGANVAAASSIITLTPVNEGEVARLTVDVNEEIRNA